MTFWDFLTKVGTLLWKNGTKVLGVAQGTVSLLAGMVGVIPESHLKWWLAASAVLTFWRGFSNSATISNPPFTPEKVK